MTINLKNFSVPLMLAQRVMPRLQCDRLDDKEYMDEVLRLVDAGVGGFILFGGDFYEARHQLARLQARAKVPLMIVSDMERGAGQQLKGATVTPCQMAVAAATDLVSRDGLGLVSEMLTGVAEEARWAGVHGVLGPVLDVNSNPQNPIICTRAFSDEPQVVAALGEVYINGLQGAASPVMACAKHFPGHGETGMDSHKGLPIIEKDRDSLEEEDMLPFRKAVMAGVEMTMTGHLMVPDLDPLLPAGLSQKVTRGYLRNRFGFTGLVLTDALDMGALTGLYTPREAARLAIKAGADILLHPAEPLKFIEDLADLAGKKEVTKEDAMASAGRLARAKTKYCTPVRLTERQISERMSGNRSTAQAVAQRAMTLVKAGGAFPSIGEIKGQVAHIVLDDDNDPKAGRVLRSLLAARHKRLANLIVPRGETARLRTEALKRSRASALTIISIFSKVAAGKGSSGISPELMELGVEIVRKNRRCVVVSFGSPYILRHFMEAEHVVAAYDPGEAMQEAACRAFMGEIVFMGELPVRI